MVGESFVESWVVIFAASSVFFKFISKFAHCNYNFIYTEKPSVYAIQPSDHYNSEAKTSQSTVEEPSNMGHSIDANDVEDSTNHTDSTH